MKLLSILLQQTQVVANEPVFTHKFDVVVGVIAVVFAGIVIYLISLDRKIAKLEK